MPKKSLMRQKGQHTVWLKYAVTYLLVLAVPLLAFSAFFSLYISKQTQKDVEAAMGGILTKVQTDFDQKVNQMFAISAQLSRVRDFKPGMLSQYSYETRQAIRSALGAYAATNMFFQDIVYYHRQLPDVVFTTSGTYSASFYRVFYDPDLEGWRTLDQMDARQLTRRWFLNSENVSGRISMGDALFYCQPLEDEQGGYLLFEIREASIGNLFAAVTPNSQVYILLGDRALYPFRPSALPENIHPGEAPQRLADGRYQLALSSPSTGLTYVYISEASDIGAVAQATLNAFMLLTVVVGLCCFIMVVLAAGRHAKPIDQLVSLSAGIAPDDVRGVASIQSALHQLQSRSQELDVVLQDAMRGHALIRLIRGKYRSGQEAEDNLRRLDMTFRQPYRVIMLLRQDMDWEEADLSGRVTAYLSRQHDTYGFAYAERSVYVLMVGMASADRQALAQELTEMTALPEFGGGHLHFSLGGSFTAFTGAQESYMQALSSSRRDPGALVTLFQENDENELFYPREELRALGTALANQDRNRTAFLYDVLLTLVQKHNHIYFYTVSLLSEMIHLYLQALSLQNTDRADGPDTYAASLKGEYINDVDDMLVCLRRLHTRALQLMTESDLSSSATEMTGIANYISACEEWDTLTVGAVADRFGINVSSLSHKFKEQMGCNISDYILTCKMNHACTLLRATDETVADIAQRVGYSQYTSFVRTFKRLKGMTPTAYRDAWRGENAPEG